MSGPDPYEPMSGMLLDLLEVARLRLALDESEPSLVHIAPGGEVAWDDCCAGQLYARMTTAYPAGPILQQHLSTKCDAPFLSAGFALGLMRCAHTVTDQGKPPTAAEMTADALRVLRDQALLLEVLRCRFPEGNNAQGRIIQAWTPQGPLGGCVGGEWAFTVAFSMCSCPPEF